MAKTAFLNMRLHEGLKAEAEVIYTDLGLSLREAVTIFLRQSIKAGGFPFAMRTRGENAVAPDTMETAENETCEEQAPTPAALEMQEMLDRVTGILESFGVPISMTDQQDDETLEQFAVRFGTATQASLAKLPRGKRRQAQRDINKAMDHLQARLTQA